MRLLASVILMVVALPLSGSFGTRSQCKRACDRDYDLCLKRAANKKARKTCSTFKRTCSRGCPAV